MPSPTPSPTPSAQAAYDELHLDKQLCLALQVASSLVTKIYRGLLEPLGLTHPQYLVLIALWERTERTSMGDLRRSLCMDTGAVTPLVKRMETAGLLRRVRDEVDERRVWVDLTDAGWALRDQVLQVRRGVVDRLPLSAEQIAAMRSSLQALNADMLAAAPPIR
ncbi:MarR family transcriptional regulator [Caulobacter sp. CCNWLY153]|uniref:ArsR family transcriptional regulator n=2 Tax=Caulobacter TaxID=75 RepID=A0A2T9JB24_9CAUL|nr:MULTISPECIES: MarR family transcriptional regulator [Caulobacter]NGM49360.1 MarR family transcriptional regulator [Caulobacter sp. 602-2]PVM79427.1 ArsR family transcriptional regulator [Caulobacter radicis]PVM83514.1 ArsR family transcriptional regulator [Caulobacter radicis]